MDSTVALNRRAFAPPVLQLSKVLSGGLQVDSMEVGSKILDGVGVELRALALLHEPPEQSCRDLRVFESIVVEMDWGRLPSQDLELTVQSVVEETHFPSS